MAVKEMHKGVVVVLLLVVALASCVSGISETVPAGNIPPPTSAQDAGNAAADAQDASAAQSDAAPTNAVDGAGADVSDVVASRDASDASADANDGSTPVFVVAVYPGSGLRFADLAPAAATYPTVADGTTDYAVMPRAYDGSGRFRFQIYDAPVDTSAWARQIGGPGTCLNVIAAVDAPHPQVRVFAAERGADGRLSPESSWLEVQANTEQAEEVDGVCGFTVLRSASVGTLTYSAFHANTIVTDSVKYDFLWQITPEFLATDSGTVDPGSYQLIGRDHEERLSCLNSMDGRPAIYSDPVHGTWVECVVVGAPAMATPSQFELRFTLGGRTYESVVGTPGGGCAATPGINWWIMSVASGILGGFNGAGIVPLYDPGPGSGLACVTNAGASHNQVRQVLPATP